MISKPPEYWFVLAGMVIYVATRDAEKQPILIRSGKTVASALLAVGLSPELAPFIGGSESIATVVIMAVGLIALDVGVALVKDRAFIKELIRARLGGGSNGQP